MSILPLIGLRTVITMFSIPVEVLDVVYITEDNADRGIEEEEDSDSQAGERTIQAAIDPTNSRTLQNVFGGNLSDGDIGIFYEGDLYIDDEYEIGAERKQSFVFYSGVKYRVKQKVDWTQQVGVWVYLASRYVTQN